MIATNISVNSLGHLTLAGRDVILLAEKYGTPLYLMDEGRIRENCRMYKRALGAAFGSAAMPLYAGKAAAFKRIYAIMAEEGMGVDAVSPGEIYTAKSALFPMERVYYHGNNKTDEDVRFAMDCGVGCFVADNLEELAAVSREAAARGITQKVLLRLTPGIDPHTYAAVSTGKVDSKFGIAIETGQAEQAVDYATGLPGIKLAGFHCHVGSQVFGEDVFCRAAEVMLRFIAMLRETRGFETQELDLGGGYGVPYVESDGEADIAGRLAELAQCIKNAAARLGVPVPKILVEPGRSIVADAGMTLYSAGAVKRIPGYKNYVSVDGGMTDNPRYALYGSKYTVFAAGRMNEEATLRCDLAGRCCESGDIIQPDVLLPEVRRGDIIAVATTGAYNYSMASNYNRFPRPPIVMLAGERDYLAVRRETLEDLTRNDL